MNHRTLRDPHSPRYEWRVAKGVREYRYNYTYLTGNWVAYSVGVRFEPTPEHITIWAELTLQPFDV